MEEWVGLGHDHVRRHRGTARRFSEDQNVAWIAPERCYVLLHPSESLALILYPPIPCAAWPVAGGCDPRSGLEAVRCQVAEDPKPKSHRDDDDVAPRLLYNRGAVVAVGRTADKAAAMEPYPDGKRSSRLNHFRIIRLDERLYKTGSHITGRPPSGWQGCVGSGAWTFT